jgi:hypothetical protein
VPAGTAQGSYDREAISKPLARRFGDDPEGLVEAVLRIGGREVERVPGQGRAFIFEALPRVPLKLVFEEPDEEFGPEFIILYDRHSIEYMQFEALAFLGGLLLTELLGVQGD